VLRLFAEASGGTVLHEQEDYLDNTASWSWQQLAVGKLATVDCWAEVYVENLSGQAVWFDDLEIATGALPVAIVVQETHYDPWGLELAGIGYNAGGNPEHRWKFNGGVERMADFGLHWDESGARMYDMQVPRFLGVDPLADEEGQESWTPYHYGFNNPARYNDPDGKCPTCDGMAETIAATAVGTVKDLAVSLFNAGAMLVDPVGAATGVLTGQGLGNLRASIAEDGSLSVGNRPAATSVGQAAGYVVSDAGDLINTGTTVATGGGAGAAKTGVVIMAKTAGKGVLVNAAVQKAKQFGSYVIDFVSGKQYFGKGDTKRMNTSAKKVAKDNNDPVVSKKWQKAANEREALKAESRKLQKAGGHNSSKKSNPKVYNKRDSPGTKYRKEDGEL
jgi:RHS repeat-associated protein